MKTTQPIKQTTYTWRITFLVYLPTATPDWMCCSPIHQNTKPDTGLIRKLRLKHPHTTHIGFASEPSAMSMSRSYGLLHGLTCTVHDYTVACIRIIVQQKKTHNLTHKHTGLIRKSRLKHPHTTHIAHKVSSLINDCASGQLSLNGKTRTNRTYPTCVVH